MTEAEVRAGWIRYMHRSDISADLDLVLDMAIAEVRNRATFDLSDETDETIFGASPKMINCAGLVELCRLAHDDAGLIRENAQFDQSFRLFAGAWARSTIRPEYRFVGDGLEE